MLALLCTLLLAAVSIGYVLVPLTRRAGPVEDDDTSVDQLRERQDASVAALRELEYEHEIGKLSDAEYFSLRDRYARHAMALLKLVDEREAARDQAIEQEVAGRRMGATAAPAVSRPNGNRPGARNRRASVSGTGRSARRWLLTTGAGALAVVIAILLLFSTIHRETAHPLVVGHVPLAMPRALAFVPGAGGALLAAGDQGLIRGSVGGTWNTVTSPSLPGHVAALLPAPDGQGVATLNGIGHMAVSRDGGAAWTALPNAPALPPGATAVSEVPGPPLLIFAGTAQGVEVSSDNGHTWTAANGFVNGLLPSGAVYGLAYAATGDSSAAGPSGAAFRGLLFAATDRGLYRTGDAGQSWQALPLAVHLVAITADPTSPSHLIAMDDSGQLYQSRDSGASWAH